MHANYFFHALLLWQCVKFSVSKCPPSGLAPIIGSYGYLILIQRFLNLDKRSYQELFWTIAWRIVPLVQIDTLQLAPQPLILHDLNVIACIHVLLSFCFRNIEQFTTWLLPVSWIRHVYLNKLIFPYGSGRHVYNITGINYLSVSYLQHHGLYDSSTSIG